MLVAGDDMVGGMIQQPNLKQQQGNPGNAVDDMDLMNLMDSISGPCGPICPRYQPVANRAFALFIPQCWYLS